MDQDLLTEAARRAVEAATIIAVQNGEMECEPLHLLWALVLDESRASEVLREAGVNRERLRAVSPLVVEQDVPLDVSAEDWPTVSQTEAFRRVIASATQAASLRGGTSQVSTDDLLAALVTGGSAASRVLLSLGVTPQRLGMSGDSLGEPAEPISVDFDIRWRDAHEEDRSQTLRIIDAAANRAREGLRVMEDYARFALDDSHLTRRLKECRHQLREALSALPADGLLRSRETEADVGTTISTQ
jgi:thiamine-phosphate pyrophosphorylase